MVRSLVVAMFVASLSAGCVYMKESVSSTTVAKGSYENYPTSLEANKQRRAKRRKYALIAAPIEVVVGTALAAAAGLGDVQPSMADSTTGKLADAGKGIVGRALLISLGAVVACSGIGDGVLGALSPLLPNSLIRNGELVPKDKIDGLPPPSTVRPTFEFDSLTSMRGLGGDVALGGSRWLGSSVRLSGAVVGELEKPWRSLDMRGSLYGQLELERAFGRDYLGLYPHSSIGVYAYGGGTAIQDRDASGPIVGGGLSTHFLSMLYRLGVSYIPHVDPHPMIGMQIGADIWLE